MSTTERVLKDGWGLTGRVSPLGDGHINDTFLVECLTNAATERFVLQKINHAVFHRPHVLAANQQRVVAHVRSVSPGFVPDMLTTREGAPAWIAKNKTVWKLARYVENSRTCRTPNREEVEAAAQAFGRYQRCMTTFAGPAIEDPIPGFLRLPGYLDAWDNTPSSKSRTEHDWGAFIDDRRSLAEWFTNADRYIHGDCKVDNVLFAADGSAVTALIDLDTTMFGHWAWDFGDFTRSAATSNGHIDLDLFAAAVRGFAATQANPQDTSDLVMAPRYMAFCLGVRFLTDHLKGNVHFKVSHAGQNLQRATQQFELLESMERAADAMMEIAVATLAEI